MLCESIVVYRLVSLKFIINMIVSAFQGSKMIGPLAANLNIFAEVPIARLSLHLKVFILYKGLTYNFLYIYCVIDMDRMLPGKDGSVTLLSIVLLYDIS